LTGWPQNLRFQFPLVELECTAAEEYAERKRGDSSVVLRCIPMAIQAQTLAQKSWFPGGSHLNSRSLSTKPAYKAGYPTHGKSQERQYWQLAVNSQGLLGRGPLFSPMTLF
jgi:hypothetical protein